MTVLARMAVWLPSDPEIRAVGRRGRAVGLARRACLPVAGGRPASCLGGPAGRAANWRRFSSGRRSTWSPRVIARASSACRPNWRRLDGPVIWMTYGNVPAALTGFKIARAPSWVTLEDIQRQVADPRHPAARTLAPFRERVLRAQRLYLLSPGPVAEMLVWNELPVEWQLVRDYGRDLSSVRQITRHWFGGGEFPRYLYRKVRSRHDAGCRRSTANVFSHKRPRPNDIPSRRHRTRTPPQRHAAEPEAAGCPLVFRDRSPAVLPGGLLGLPLYGLALIASPTSASGENHVADGLRRRLFLRRRCGLPGLPERRRLAPQPRPVLRAAPAALSVPRMLARCRCRRRVHPGGIPG